MNTAEHRARLGALPTGVADGKVVAPDAAADLLLAVLRSGDRVVLEGCNQKQAAFLSCRLASLPASALHDLHMLMSCVALDDHVELFRRGIASRLDFAFSGPQAVALAELVATGKVRVGAIHTYLELYSRYFTDLPPDAALVCGESADADGNLYLGANAEDTPLLCEAAHGRKGIVIAEVERVVDCLERVDVPGDQVDFVIATEQPCTIEPLFTRDPGRITDRQVLMAAMVIKGIYAEYGVQRLNHGIGYATAAIELLLPTYAEELGLRGRICSHWLLNPHPTLIPAIEAGFVQSVYSFGSEPGMDAYIAARPDLFFTDARGVLRSNRALAHAAGHYDAECFTGATLQIDADGNSSTVTRGRISGFGGAPNLGADAGGRRHATEAWLKAGREAAGDEGLPRGRKLVVQVTPTVSEKKGIPVFVDELDAVALAREGAYPIPPVMIYGRDVTHVVTERGVAYLLRCGDVEQRRAAIRAVAGDTPVGRRGSAQEARELRGNGLVAEPTDLGVNPERATRDLLAAKSMDDLVAMSGGLYSVPDSLR